VYLDFVGSWQSTSKLRHSGATWEGIQTRESKRRN